jgi:hypothetical protein
MRAASTSSRWAKGDRRNDREPHLVAKSSTEERAARQQPFGHVLRDLLIENGYTTVLGNPDWPRFALELDGIGYESLRKAVSREREPSVKIMRACATALSVEPAVFWEYQLAEARRAFDIREVGEDEAFANLQRWLSTR